MNKGEFSEDLAFLLFAVPFAGTGILALVSWAPSGISLFLPRSVYLSVTKDPLVFLLGFTAILLSLIIEIYGSDPETRMGKVQETANRMEKLAIVSLILAALFAWSATGFSSDLVKPAALLVEGRYAVIFPTSLLLTARALVLTVESRLEKGVVKEVISVLALAASPIMLLVLLNTSGDVGLAVLASGLVFLVGLVLSARIRWKR